MGVRWGGGAVLADGACTSVLFCAGGVSAAASISRWATKAPHAGGGSSVGPGAPEFEPIGEWALGVWWLGEPGRFDCMVDYWCGMGTACCKVNGGAELTKNDPEKIRQVAALVSLEPETLVRCARSRTSLSASHGADNDLGHWSRHQFDMYRRVFVPAILGRLATNDQGPISP